MMDIRNIDNKTYGLALYGSLLKEKNITEIKHFRQSGTEVSSNHRKVYAIITAYKDYGEIQGRDMGKIYVEHRYMKVPNTRYYYKADVWLEYKGRYYDLEYDPNHGKQKERDRIRDLHTKSNPNTEVLRFIIKDSNNKAIDTAKCYILKGKRSKSNPTRVTLTDEDILKIFSALNDLYGLCLNEKAILKYFKANIRYKASYFLTEEEIEGIKEKELEDEKRNSSNKNRVIQRLKNENQAHSIDLCYI